MLNLLASFQVFASLFVSRVKASSGNGNGGFSGPEQLQKITKEKTRNKWITPFTDPKIGWFEF